MYDNPHYADIQKSFNARYGKNPSTSSLMELSGESVLMSGRCTIALVNRLWVVLKSLPWDSTICVVSKAASFWYRTQYQTPFRRETVSHQRSQRGTSVELGISGLDFLPRSVTRRDRFMYTPPLHSWNSL